QRSGREGHLVHGELFDEVAGEGHAVAPGELGENITTSGLDLLGLPCGAVLRFGPSGDGPIGQPLPVARGGGPEADATAEAGTARDAVAEVGAVAGRAKLDGPTTEAVAAVVAAAERDAAAPDRADPRPAVVVTGLRN